MERAYIECAKEIGEHLDEYMVIIPLSNGKIHSGIVKKEHFNAEGLLKTLILEDFGKDAIVLLPEKMGHRETLKIKSKHLMAA